MMGTYLVGPSGVADYSTLAAWESEQRDLVSLGESEVVELEEFEDTTQVVIDGWGTNASFGITIQPADGVSHGGVLKPSDASFSGYLLNVDVNGAALGILNDNVTVKGIGILNPRTTQAYTTAITATASNLLVDGVIAEGHRTRVIRTDTSSGDRQWRNCIVYHGTGGSAGYRFYPSNNWFYNCLSISINGNGAGFYNYASAYPPHCYNCISYLSGTSYLDFSDDSDCFNLAASDGGSVTPPGSNPYASDVTSADFVDAANDDWHLDSGSDLVDAGYDLSAVFTNDIDGDTRPTGGAWSIGPDHIAVAGTLIALSDSVTGTETLGIGVGLALADAAEGQEAFPGMGVDLNLADVATSSEQTSVANALSVFDTGVGADSIGGLTISLYINDTASGVDAISVAFDALKVITDSAAGSDAIQSVNVQLALPDAASGSDLVNTITDIIKTIFDGGTGSDALSASVTTQLIDAGELLDEITLAVNLTVADTGLATDAVLSQLLISLSDSGVGSDLLSLSVAVPISDMASGHDMLNISSLLSLIDSAGGTDAVVHFDTNSRVAKIVFTLSHRRITFTNHLARSMRFTLH